jgi:ATP-dependent RNA helicase DDX56/DBP9
LARAAGTWRKIGAVLGFLNFPHHFLACPTHLLYKMKRKLNVEGVPEEIDSSSSKDSFQSLNLDPRLLRAIQSLNFSTPTAIQSRIIPLILQGSDVLARSKTGSGKTAAYILPILQNLLSRKSANNATGEKAFVSALILVPTRELAGQVTKAIESFTSFCSGLIKVENITKKEDDRVQRARLAGNPDIVVATPGRVAVHINGSAVALEKLTYIVIDEADLILSYGYEDDLQTIAKAVPKGVQTMLMSATLKADISTLKGLFGINPKVVALDEEEKGDESVSQYVVKCAEDEKFLLCYAIFILKLIKGKMIIFVGDIDRCYRLKLFLEQFGIKSCVLNAELPVNSRIHVVEEFNKNVYDIIIAVDENEVIGDEHIKSKKGKSDQDDQDTQDTITGQKENEPGKTNGAPQKDDVEEEEPIPQNSVAEPSKKRRKGPQKDKDYGVARGIDFRNVSCVLNFDLPTSSKSYTHRIGRTARAGKTGMALSFVIPKEQYRKHPPTSIPSAEHDEEVLTKIIANQEKKGAKVEPYAFDMSKLEGFRYRFGSALKAVTNSAIREARVRELRQELIKSEKLGRYFEENPDDLKHLRHDGMLRPAKVQPHLKHVPDYLVPGGTKKALAEEVGFVGMHKRDGDKRRRGKGRSGRGGKKGVGKKVNPLQSFRGNAKK